MCDGRKELPGIELFRKHVEGFWILAEVGDVKDCFCVWEVESGQVGVESGVGRSEVWDSSAGRNASSGHNDDLLWPAALVPHVIGDGVKSARGEGVGMSVRVDQFVGVLLPHLVTFVPFVTTVLGLRSMRFSMLPTYIVTVVMILLSEQPFSKSREKSRPQS